MTNEIFGFSTDVPESLIFLRFSGMYQKSSSVARVF